MMVLDIHLGDIGLISDLLGAVLLFVYGIAPLLSKDGSMSLSAGTSDYLKRKAEKYELLSRLGVLLIVVGFAFQLLGNHINFSIAVNLGVLISVLGLFTVAIIIFRTINRFWKRGFNLRAQYLPQFEETKPIHNGKHMWTFEITNNTIKTATTATLYLSSSPRTVILLTTGKEPQTLTPSEKIHFEEIRPRDTVRLQVWNIGGHITDGLDCYLEVNGKVYRPNVLHFDGAEQL